jgi:3-dehydroquinate synthase
MQVDAGLPSHGGIHLRQGKNLVGAFRQPDLVLIDPEVLETLPESVLLAGMAEVVKYGCIRDPGILEIVSKPDWKSRLGELIERCVGIKIKVVEADEMEAGLRRILNFGHTIGHGIEKLGNFTELSHGEAVAVGMAAAAKLGENAGITKSGCHKRLTAILKSLVLPTELTHTSAEVYEALLSDKKRQGDGIHFIFIEDFGRTEVRKVPVAELKQMMKVLGD